MFGNHQDVLKLINHKLTLCYICQKKKLIQHSCFFFLYFAKSTSFAKVVSVSALTDAAIWSKMFNFEIYIESYAHTLG